MASHRTLALAVCVTVSGVILAQQSQPEFEKFLEEFIGELQKETQKKSYQQPRVQPHERRQPVQGVPTTLSPFRKINPGSSKRALFLSPWKPDEEGGTLPRDREIAASWHIAILDKLLGSIRQKIASLDVADRERFDRYMNEALTVESKLDIIALEPSYYKALYTHSFTPLRKTIVRLGEHLVRLDAELRVVPIEPQETLQPLRTPMQSSQAYRIPEHTPAYTKKRPQEKPMELKEQQKKPKKQVSTINQIMRERPPLKESLFWIWDRITSFFKWLFGGAMLNAAEAPLRPYTELGSVALQELEALFSQELPALNAQLDRLIATAKKHLKDKKEPRLRQQPTQDEAPPRRTRKLFSSYHP